MTIVKRIITAISMVMCITIVWIPIHFALKTLMYGNKSEQRSSSSKMETQTKNL